MADEKRITVTYRRASDYRVIPATGAWGGPTVNGQIFMNLVVEHASMPNLQTFAQSAEGTIDFRTPLESISAGDGEREILVGVVLAPATARAIATWLINHADTIEGKSGGQ